MRMLMEKTLFGVLAACVLAMASPAIGALGGPGTYIEDFGANGNIGLWDRLDYVPGSLTNEADVSPADGLPDSVTFPGDRLRIFEAYKGAAVHLEMDNVPTNAGVRLDANMFQGVVDSNVEHWGLQTGIYYDTNNWVYLARSRDAGGGYRRIMKVNGVESNTNGHTGYFDDWHMQGIELTPTQVKFYASPASPHTFGTTDFDANMTLDLSSITMARPASFTGNATLLVGKGYSYAGGDPGDATWDLVSPKVTSFHSTRIILVPEPGSIAILAGAGLLGVSRRRRA